MNGPIESFDDKLLDRLVDGELLDVEYRRLLKVLESHPDGWRRCALAFLEAQAWGREAHAIRAEAAVPRAEPSRSRAGPSWLYVGAMVLACSASFLLAFGFATNWKTEDGQQQLVTNGPALNPHSPQVDSNSQLVADFQPQPGIHPQTGQAGPLVGRYRVLVDGDSAQLKAVEMPLFAADDPRAGMLLDEYATQPRELIRALESNGIQVRRQRNWISMPGNPDGPVYVPVDELQVTPVSNRSFQ